MVLREGAELVLILRAVELSTEGVAVWIGTGLGIAIAIAVGLFFFQGTLRIPLGRFFAVTSTILMVVAFQLALTGIHELSEAMWLPSSKREMSTIGPIVRNEVFFFVVILGVAGLAVLREWFRPSAPAAADAAGNPAEQRRRNMNGASSADGASLPRRFVLRWCWPSPRNSFMPAFPPRRPLPPKR
jgi:high-affinity iron transporter